MITKTLPKRQAYRRALTLFFFIAFPVILNYFSPYLIIDGGSQGIASGSMIVFAFMFGSALFFGRLWCGWVCAMGGLQDIVTAITHKPVNPRKIGWIKWLVWVPWFSMIIWVIIQAGGLKAANFLYMTETGISVTEPMQYITYFTVIGLVVLLAFTVGRRGFCHTACWMAPFMILGRSVRNLFGWPSLRLVANTDACANCKTCTQGCPMSLDVNNMVQARKMENPDCILCGACVDNCSKKVIHYSFSKGI